MLEPLHIEKTSPIRATGLSVPHVPENYLEPPAREDVPHIDKDAAAIVLDELLVRVARHESLCRLRIGRLAARLLESRAYHVLGFARVGDYTLERLGLSAREIQSAAHVWRAVAALPALAQAFRAGQLNWTKLRMVCDVAEATTADHWIALAQRMTSRELGVHIKEWQRAGAMSSEVGAPSVTASDEHQHQRANATEHANANETANGNSSGNDDIDDDPDLIDGEPRAEVQIRCPAHLRPLWHDVSELASRSAGSVLSQWQALELVCAEASSGVALAPPMSFGPVSGDRAAGGPRSGSDIGGHLRDAGERGDGGIASDNGDGDDDDHRERRCNDAIIRVAGRDPQFERRQRLSGWDGELEVLRSLVSENVCLDFHEYLDDELKDELDGNPDAAAIGLDATELDDALRAVLDSMRSIDWQLGRLLATFARLSLHRHIGYPSFAVYVCDRLGLSSRKASSLVRVEGNPDAGRGELASAYRSGRISWIRAIALLPVLSERHADVWIERAEQVTVRRLLDEVRWALDMRDRGWLFMELVPPTLGATLEHSDAAADRQMRALYDADMVERIQQRPRLDSTHLRLSGPVSVIAFFHDVLRSYSDADGPWEPAWKPLERMLLHVKAHWSGVPSHRNPIHERDGWRCRVPACSSRRNLQEHHVLFRSRGGGNERGNRISICAWHHLRGIHAGRVRAHGDAETGIHWQLGPTPSLVTLVDDTYTQH